MVLQQMQIRRPDKNQCYQYRNKWLRFEPVYAVDTVVIVLRDCPIGIPMDLVSCPQRISNAYSGYYAV